MTIDDSKPAQPNDRPDAPRAMELTSDKVELNRPTGPTHPSHPAPSGRMPLFGR